MNLSHPIKDAEFVMSKDSFGYQKVLDDIPNADEIIIVTYNISTKSDYLMNKLKSVKDNCKITIVTNIPNRWNYYFNEYARNTARRNISIYVNKLSPELNQNLHSTFFDFSNHSKIIMTNNVAYIGSQNFSDESANNTEMGVLTTDSDFIRYVKNVVVPEIISESTPHLNREYLDVLLLGNLLLGSLATTYEDFMYQTHQYSDDHSREGIYIFNSSVCNFTQQRLDSIFLLLESIINNCETISDILETDILADEFQVGELIEGFNAIVVLARVTMEITENDTLTDLAKYDPESDLQTSLEEDYGMNAYDEYLDEIIENLSQRANGRLSDYADEAYDDISALSSNLKSLHSMYEIELSHVNNFWEEIFRKIDNT